MNTPVKPYTLECCVDSVESALQAVKGGATRLELCGNLPIGGTTPELALFRQIRQESDIRIHVLIRPRFGDFCYSPYEMAVMEDSIRMFREAGAEAAVIGVLQPDGNLDIQAMKRLIATARGENSTQTGNSMNITLHRAFDMCRDPFQTLAEAIDLGINTILTSGQAADCVAGSELLRQLARKADGRIEILAGAGISADAIRTLYPLTGVTSYHMSGKVVINSRMEYRNPKVNMGLPSMSEYEIWQTSAERVREAANVLNGFLTAE